MTIVTAATPGKSSRAKIIKIADKVSNLRSLVKSAIGKWSQERKQIYLAWAREVVDGARGVNAWLEDTTCQESVLYPMQIRVNFDLNQPVIWWMSVSTDNSGRGADHDPQQAFAP